MTRIARVPSLALLLAVAALALAGASGCDEEFDPYNRLKILRVLAIKSEPAAPAPGETTTLNALVYTPMPDPSVTYAWSWCPLAGSPSDGYPCQITEAQLQMLAAQAGVTVPAFDLGAGPTVTLKNSIPPAILQQLCAGTPGVPVLPDCEGGFPVQVKVTVRTATDEVVAVRSVRLRFDPATPANTNPRIDGLLAALDADGNPDTPETMDVALPEVALTDVPADPLVALPRNRDSIVKAQVPLELAETYMGKNADGQPAPVRERLILSWFIESGDTREERTGFIEGVMSSRPWTETKWKPAKVKDYPAATSRLLVVIRDSRGGVNWRSTAVKLTEAP